MTCRACKSVVEEIVDFGRVPLANDFDTKGGYHPLRFGICHGCGLLQVMDDVPPEQMFVEYPWVSGTSRTMQGYAKTFAQFVFEDHRKRDITFALPYTVLEIASNDGLLLGELQSKVFSVLGVDPSSAANIANSKGLTTIRAFFGAELASNYFSPNWADIVIARNVVGHVKDPVDLVLGIDKVLSENGEVYIESPYAGLLRDQLQYDTIFHEHCSYFTITTLADLLGRELGLPPGRAVRGLAGPRRSGRLGQMLDASDGDGDGRGRGHFAPPSDFGFAVRLRLGFAATGGVATVGAGAGGDSTGAAGSAGAGAPAASAGMNFLTPACASARSPPPIIGAA